ncbi:hypothetical protein HDZ31DRAFT_60954 [Schizophyllum fasciatum]
MLRIRRPRFFDESLLRAGPGASGEDVLPVEVWYSIFSYCHPHTLLLLERVCRTFRGIIRSREGRLLINACMLRKNPARPEFHETPPVIKLPAEGVMSDEARGARLLVRYGEGAKGAAHEEGADKDEDGAQSGGDGAQVGSDISGADPEIVAAQQRYACYMGAKYLRFLYGGGPCTVCGRFSAKPPHDLVTLTRICTSQCTRRLHHENFIVPMPAADKVRPGGPRVGRWREEDAQLEPWLPFIKGRGDRLVFTRDLKRARQEYQQLSGEKRKVIYEERRLMLAALLKLRNNYRSWVRVYKDRHRRLQNVNMRWLRGFARKSGSKPARLLAVPAVKHTFDNYTATETHLHRSALKHAHKKGYIACEACDMFVPEGIWMAHTIGRHPELAPLTRRNPETKEDERRCPQCPKSTKWYPMRSGALQRHIDAKHSGRPVANVQKAKKDVIMEAVAPAVTIAIEACTSTQVLGKRRAESPAPEAPVKRVKQDAPSAFVGRHRFALAGYKQMLTASGEL